MTRLYRILWCFALFCTFLSTAGCKQSAEINETETFMQQISPEVIYNQALDQLTKRGNFGLDVTAETYTSTDKQTFHTVRTYRISFSDFEGVNQSVAVEELFSNGSYSFAASHGHSNSTAFLTIGQQAQFIKNMSFKAYAREMHLPFLPDPSMYNMIEDSQTETKTTVTLSQPKKAESWIDLGQFSLKDASATILLNDNGSFEHCTYQLSCENGAVSILQKYSFAVLEDISAQPLSVPDSGIEVQRLSAPLLMEQYCSYLYSAQSVSTEKEYAIFLSDLSRTQTTQMEMWVDGGALEASVNSQVQIKDSTRSAEPTTHSQTETFRDGKYQLTSDGVISGDPNVTSEIMEDYCREILLDCIPTADALQTFSLTKTGRWLTFTLEPTEDFARSACGAACNALYGDNLALESLAADYITDMIVCTLSIDLTSGLPAKVQVTCQGTYTIEDKPFTIYSQTTQSYTFP